MTKPIRFLALLMLLTTIAAQAGQLSPNRLNVLLNGSPRVLEYRLWSGHPFVNVKDTYMLDWTPYWDNVHKLADIAGCLRLELGSRRVVGVWRSASIQGIAVDGGQPDLPVPTRTVNQEMWIPLDSVAKNMGYSATFDSKKQMLTLKTAVKPDDMSFPGYCQYMLQARP